MITVYTGPMFSGKSTHLIETYNMITDKDTCLCFKPSKDKRDLTKLRARNVSMQVQAIVLTKFEEILKYVTDNIKFIFIDEAQFINGNFNILSKLSIEKDINIYIAGLNQTSEQRPFGTMPYIMAIANDILIFEATCECGRSAYYTFCKKPKKTDILIGNSEYIPVCKECLKMLKNKE